MLFMHVCFATPKGPIIMMGVASYIPGLPPFKVQKAENG
jgi:hypothetical protein